MAALPLQCTCTGYQEVCAFGTWLNAVAARFTCCGIPVNALCHHSCCAMAGVLHFDVSKTLEGTSGVCSNVYACGQLYAGVKMAGIACNHCRLQAPERRSGYGCAWEHCETGVFGQSHEHLDSCQDRPCAGCMHGACCCECSIMVSCAVAHLDRQTPYLRV